MDMEAMPPQGAPEAEEAKSGGASEKIAAAHTALMEVMDILSGAKGMEQEKDQLSQIIAQYQGMVQQLSQPQGAPKPEAPSAPGSAPMESGTKEVQPAL